MVTGRSHEVMAASCLLLAKSGTTTLEAALFGTPMVAIYRTSHLSYIIARLMVRLKHFTLPNILAYDYAPAGRKAENIITELAQHEVTGTRIAQEAGKLLDNDTLSQHISQHLRSLIDDLGGRGASRRCAEAVKEYLFS